MTSDIPIQYSKKIVAFVDILGFSSLVKRIEREPKLHNDLHWALTHIHSYKNWNVDASVFSDSIAISSEPKNIHDVIWVCVWLQAKLLGVGILTRGGIALGFAYHSNDIIYGKAMLDACLIEKSSAFYPRIALHPEVAKLLPEQYKNIFLDLDSDGLWFIDPFSLPINIEGNLDELVADGWDPHELFLNELGQHIEDEIKKVKEVNHLVKWEWLRKRYTLAKENYLKTRETKFSYLKLLAEQRDEGAGERCGDAYGLFD